MIPIPSSSSSSSSSSEAVPISRRGNLMSRSFSSLCSGLKAIGDAIAGVALAIFNACCCRSFMRQLTEDTQSRAIPMRYVSKTYNDAQAKQALGTLLETHYEQVKVKLVHPKALEAFRQSASAEDVDVFINDVLESKANLEAVGPVVLAGAIKKLFGSSDIWIDSNLDTLELKSEWQAAFTNYLKLAKEIVNIGSQQPKEVECCRTHKAMAVLIAPTIFPEMLDSNNPNLTAIIISAMRQTELFIDGAQA